MAEATPTPARFALRSFGCRANQADGAALAAALSSRGWSAAAVDEADCVVFNTCTVTAAADAEVRQAIRRLHRRRPQVRIVVTGCYAQRDPAALAALEGVDLVVDNTARHRLPALLEQSGLPKLVTAERFERSQIQVAPPAGDGRTRATLKVQDGCANRCAYCIIPAVRGPSRSLPLGDTLRQVEAWVAAGHREIVLSGINLGQWGRDLDSSFRLLDLVAAILDRTALVRLRLSSVEPMDWSDALIDRMAAEAAADQPRFARHAHIPLQSGSDTVLRRMHRRYRPWHYAERVERLRARVPDAAIGADVMVGFPGETETEFEETCRFLDELPFTYLHLFTFSNREGTEADRRLQDAGREWRPVPPAVAAERHRRLRALIAAKRALWLQRFVGRTVPVLTLAERAAADATAALSDHFLPVRIAGAQPPNTLLRVRVTAATADGLEAVA